MAYAYRGPDNAWVEITGPFSLGAGADTKQYPSNWAEAVDDAEREAAGVYFIVEPVAPPPAGQNVAGTRLIDYTVAGKTVPLREYVLAAFNVMEAYQYKRASLDAAFDTYARVGASMAMEIISDTELNVVMIPLVGPDFNAMLSLKAYFDTAKALGAEASAEYYSAVDGSTFTLAGGPNTNYREDFFYQYFACHAAMFTNYRRKLEALNALIFNEQEPTVDQVLAFAVDVDWPNLTGPMLLPDGSVMLPTNP